MKQECVFVFITPIILLIISCGFLEYDPANILDKKTPEPTIAPVTDPTPEPEGIIVNVPDDYIFRMKFDNNLTVERDTLSFSGDSMDYDHIDKREGTHSLSADGVKSVSSTSEYLLTGRFSPASGC